MRRGNWVFLIRTRAFFLLCESGLTGTECIIRWVWLGVILLGLCCIGACVTICYGFSWRCVSIFCRVKHKDCRVVDRQLSYIAWICQRWFEWAVRDFVSWRIWKFLFPKHEYYVLKQTKILWFSQILIAWFSPKNSSLF